MHTGFSHLAQLQAGAHGAVPLVLLLLALEWVGLAVCVALFLWTRPRPGVSRRQAVAVALACGLVAAGLAALLSPGLPVLSSYTGLPHITSAYRIADLDWNWAFPADYPLAVPLLAALFVKGLGHGPAAFGAANVALFALAAAGTSLLAVRLTACLRTGLFAGLAVATLPLALVFAGGDGLEVGYLGVAPWVLLLAAGALEEGPSLAARAGTVIGVSLVAQTRPEALAFVAVVLLLPLAVPGRMGLWRGIERLARLLVPSLLLLLPYLVRLTDEFLGTGRARSELGFALVVPVLAGGAAAAGLAWLPSVWWPQLAKRPLRFPAGGMALLVVLAAVGLAVVGPEFFAPGLSCAHDGCSARTFLTLPFWPFNPKLVPWGVLLLFFTGLVSGWRADGPRLTAFLVLWVAVVTAAATTKGTGELPLEGARTQLPALVPFCILAALGLARVATFGPGRGLASAAWVGLAVVTLPLPLANLGRLDFDEQQEYRFVSDCMARLPEHAVLFVPDEAVAVRLPGDESATHVDLFTLFRSGYLTESMGEAGRQARVEGLSQEPTGLPAGRGARFFLRGLGCYRTGRPGMGAQCQAALAAARRPPVCEVRVENRMYTGDFYEWIRIVGDSVTLGIYPLDGGGEVSHAVP